MWNESLEDRVSDCLYRETGRSSGWQPWHSLETLKHVFNISSEYQDCHPDDLSVSVYMKPIRVPELQHICNKSNQWYGNHSFDIMTWLYKMVPINGRQIDIVHWNYLQNHHFIPENALAGYSRPLCYRHLVWENEVTLKSLSPLGNMSGSLLLLDPMSTISCQRDEHYVFPGDRQQNVAVLQYASGAYFTKKWHKPASELGHG